MDRPERVGHRGRGARPVHPRERRSAGRLAGLAREIAGKSPGAIRGTKRLLDQSGVVPLAQQYADERHTIASLIGTPNQVEAVAAYFEKRAPSFADPD